MYTITIDCGTSFLKAALVEYDTRKIVQKITIRTSEIETKNRFPRNLLCDYVSWKDEWALEKSERGSYLEEIASLVDMKDIESTDMTLKGKGQTTRLSPGLFLVHT